MSDSDLRAEIERLRRLLEEAESTLAAIRNGEVDALVIGGREIYTLEGADHPYRVLVEAMQQGAVTLSPDSSIVYCNTGFAHMVRRPIETIVGKPITSLFAPGERAFLRRCLAENPPSKQVELTLIADDRTHLPVLVSFNILKLNKVTALCLVITDLTEHKHNQRLQDTDRRKDEFLAMLAHELRNPLAPIANATQMLCLSKDKSGAEVGWACDIIDRQVRQMSRLVDDLLDVSRITRGKIKLQKSFTDISTILAAAVETSKPLIERRRHRLHIALPASPLRVEADVTRLAQAVTNLLNNAAKYTEEDGEIWLSADSDLHQAVIGVRDNGVGMPSEMLPKVFDLFTQADRTIDRSQGGLGIGLTLVRRLVELHEGCVSASSDGPGKGSEFVIRLPLANPASTHADGAPSKDRRTPVPNPQRILVVDDNVDAAVTLSMMLQAMGHESMVSHDGPSAIESTISFRPSLILLDIGLPGMNGYAVAEKLRKLNGFQSVVLAALTGYGEEQDRKRSKEVGFQEHFVKPLNFVELQELISSMPRLS